MSNFINRWYGKTTEERGLFFAGAFSVFILLVVGGLFHFLAPSEPASWEGEAVFTFPDGDGAVFDGSVEIDGQLEVDESVAIDVCGWYVIDDIEISTCSNTIFIYNDAEFTIAQADEYGNITIDESSCVISGPIAVLGRGE